MFNRGWIGLTWVLVTKRMFDYLRASYIKLDDDQKDPLLFRLSTDKKQARQGNQLPKASGVEVDILPIEENSSARGTMGAIG